MQSKKMFWNSKGHRWFLMSLKGSVPALSFIFHNRNNRIVPLVREAGLHEFSVTWLPQNMLALHSGGPGKRGIVSPTWGFPHGLMVKNPPANARETSSILESGRFPQRRKWQPTPVFLPWAIPWTEEPGGLQSMGSQKRQIWLSCSAATAWLDAAHPES